MAGPPLVILHVNNRWEAGGVRRCILDLSHCLETLGHRPLVAACGAGAEASAGGIGFHELPLYGSGGRKSITGFLRSRSALAALIRDLRVDVLHAHSRYAALLVRSLPARLRPAVVYTAHNIFEDAPAAAWYPRDVICPAEATARAFIAALRRPERHRVRVIRHGVDPARCLGPARLDGSARLEGLARHAGSAQDPAPALFAFAGRHVDEKGGAVLLRAARALLDGGERAWVLRVLGEGPRRREWEALAASLGLSDHVRFEGQASDPVAALHGSAAVIVPSLSREGFGYVLLDAACAGAPVIASDLPLFRELLDAGIPGMLFETGDARALAAAMLAVLQGAGLPGTFHAAFDPSAFSLERMAEETLEVYRAALAGRAQ